jgi:hypothetical protein
LPFLLTSTVVKSGRSSRQSGIPLGFLVTSCADAPFPDILVFLAFEFFELEEAEFFPDAPLRTAGDLAERDATPVFKFFEVFLELGIRVFFMRAGAGLIVTPGRSQWPISSQPMGIPLCSASGEKSLRRYFFSSILGVFRLRASDYLFLRWIAALRST